jgi:integrase
VTHGPVLQAPDAFLGDELDASVRQHLEPPELAALFEQLREDAFWGPYFSLQYFFGCRVSEVALVFDTEVSLDQNKLIIKRLKKGKNAKRPDWVNDRYPPGVMPQTYTLPATLAAEVETVREYKRRRGLQANPFLFPSRFGGTERPQGSERLSYLRMAKGTDGRFYRAIGRTQAHRRFKKAADAAELPDNLRHTHVLRHTRATLLYASDASAAQVQHLLGHSSEKTTQTYLGAAKSMRDKYDEELLQLGLEGFHD